MSNLLDQMRADTTDFLAEWGESLLRRRASISYDDGRRGIESWNSSLSFTGDFQALSGSEMRAEAGLQQRSDGKIITEYDADVLAGDRVIRSSDTFRVNYPHVYEDHQSLFMYREINP